MGKRQVHERLRPAYRVRAADDCAELAIAGGPGYVAASASDQEEQQVTTFRWCPDTLECEIVEPQHPTYVALTGNRCWALLPSDLDGYCYCVDLPSWLRVLRRFGLYLEAGGKRGRLPSVLTDLRTFYGTNYLRLAGTADGLLFTVRVFPDLEDSLLCITVTAENGTPVTRDAGVLIAADMQLHPAAWACKGFTDDAVADYSGMGRKVSTPHDDRTRVWENGPVFYVRDDRNPGAGCFASAKCAGWTLDRAVFSFETPFGGYRPGHLDLTEDRLDLTDGQSSEDSLCVVRHDLALPAGQTRSVSALIGYQASEDPARLLAVLGDAEGAFERTKAFYSIPSQCGVTIETPDPVVNAQFPLFNLFVKMNEHWCDGKRGFLPAAHYHNWLCGDFFFSALGYAYTNDLQPLLESMDYFRRSQHDDGFIPCLPLWTDGASWRDRELAPLFDSLAFVITTCWLVKFTRDREYALNLLPSLEQALALVLSSERDGLIIPRGEYAFDAIDWPLGFAHCPQTFSSCMAYKTATDLADLCDWLGRGDRAQALRARAERLKTTINDKLWNEDRGHYRIGLPVGKTGRNERDAKLFSEDMVSWSSIVAVLWGVADGQRAARAVDAVRKRLFSPLGMKFFDPHWEPSYTDAQGTLTYEAGRVQNGAWWQTWWSIESLARAEAMVGRTREALEDLAQVRLDRTYSQFTMTEKGNRMHFLRTGEWTDTDMTFPLTSIPYMLTAAFHNQTLIEVVFGVQVAYDEIVVRPCLPPSWPGARLADLHVGDSVWAIEIRRTGGPSRVLLDGVPMPGDSVPITPGRHAVCVEVPGQNQQA